MSENTIKHTDSSFHVNTRKKKRKNENTGKKKWVGKLIETISRIHLATF